MADQTHNVFRHAHAPLEAQLRQHLLAVIGGDFAQALALLQDWQDQLQKHMQLEETQLFPHIPDNARWPARLYQLEHERLTLLIQEYLAAAQAVARQPPVTEAGRRAASLALLDAAHAARHLLEHHHQREEKALAQELPLVLQRNALRTTID